MSRYIDAENILYSSVMVEEDNGNYRKMWIATKEDIDAIPTADVRENVRGEWVQDEIAKKLNVYLCSNCNIPTQIVDSDGNTKLTRYCPNCGADMRGDKDEDR